MTSQNHQVEVTKFITPKNSLPIPLGLRKRIKRRYFDDNQSSNTTKHGSVTNTHYKAALVLIILEDRVDDFDFRTEMLKESILREFPHYDPPSDIVQFWKALATKYGERPFLREEVEAFRTSAVWRTAAVVPTR